MKQACCAAVSEICLDSVNTTLKESFRLHAKNPNFTHFQRGTMCCLLGGSLGIKQKIFLTNPIFDVRVYVRIETYVAIGSNAWSTRQAPLGVPHVPCDKIYLAKQILPCERSSGIKRTTLTDPERTPGVPLKPGTYIRQILDLVWLDFMSYQPLLVI